VNTAAGFILFICIALMAAGCGSEKLREHDLEYLKGRLGKPLIYPKEMDKPKQETTYHVIDVSTTQDSAPAAIEALQAPPRLAGVEVDEEDDEDEDNDKKEDGNTKEAAESAEQEQVKQSTSDAKKK
jgi:hypothetical protein